MTTADRLLDRSPTAVADARLVVSEALVSAGIEDRIGDATLAVSELVTNALVHTTGVVELRVTTSVDGRARVEVRDDSPLLPRPALLRATAMSGRGLLLVSRLTSAWGFAPAADGGKVVWFEIEPGPSGAPSELTVDDLIAFWSADDDGATEPADGQERDVRLVGLPTTRLVATKARGEDLLREASLILSDRDEHEPGVVAVAERLSRLMHQLAPMRRAIRGQALAAAARSEPTVDLALHVAAEDAAVLDEYADALDAADRLAGEGRLLNPPATPAEAAFRRGYLKAIAEQVRGPVPHGPADPTTPD